MVQFHKLYLVGIAGYYLKFSFNIEELVRWAIQGTRNM